MIYLSEENFGRIFRTSPRPVHLPIKKRAITNPAMLNEAYTEAKPKSYSRGMRIDMDGLTILLISGTFSSDEHGNTVHVGDFRGQVRRTLENITGLLAWKAVPGTTSCVLPAICAIWIAITKHLMRCALPSSTNRSLIRCLRPQAFRPNCAGRICSLISRPSQCFKPREKTDEGNE